jgi:hypothetical protein
VAELFVSEGEAAEQRPMTETDAKVSLVSLSKPVWFYGLEALAPHLLPAAEGKRRRVAFAQCAVLGLENAVARAAQPEEALGRLSRGLPLWFAETFASSAGYEPFAAIGASDRRHYALFPTEWVAENIRQVHETTEGGLDYVVTGALRNRNDDFELSLRIWEVKKFRELKVFTTRWTPSDADVELKKFHELVRGYMEWRELSGGPAGLRARAGLGAHAFPRGKGRAGAGTGDGRHGGAAAVGPRQCGRRSRPAGARRRPAPPQGSGHRARSRRPPARQHLACLPGRAGRRRVGADHEAGVNRVGGTDGPASDQPQQKGPALGRAGDQDFTPPGYGCLAL